jgi:hypothetical protein
MADPNVTEIKAKQNIVNMRWIAYGVLDGNRNIMTSVTTETAQQAVDDLISFAKRLKQDEQQ